MTAANDCAEKYLVREFHISMRHYSGFGSGEKGGWGPWEKALWAKQSPGDWTSLILSCREVNSPLRTKRHHSALMVSVVWEQGHSGSKDGVWMYGVGGLWWEVVRGLSYRHSSEARWTFHTKFCLDVKFSDDTHAPRGSERFTTHVIRLFGRAE